MPHTRAKNIYCTNSPKYAYYILCSDLAKKLSQTLSNLRVKLDKTILEKRFSPLRYSKIIANLVLSFNKTLVYVYYLDEGEQKLEYDDLKKLI
jgi:hypothetical protein